MCANVNMCVSVFVFVFMCACAHVFVQVSVNLGALLFKKQVGAPILGRKSDDRKLGVMSTTKTTSVRNNDTPQA